MGRDWHLEDLAEGLVQQGNPAVLGLHQDASLHVLQQGHEAGGDGGQGGFGPAAFRDVIEGAGHPGDRAVGVHGDAVVHLHPAGMSLLGDEPELPPDRVLAGLQGVGEEIHVAGGVFGVHVAQEGLPKTLRQRESHDAGPGRVQQGPVPLAVNLEDHLLEVIHQGAVLEQVLAWMAFRELAPGVHILQECLPGRAAGQVHTSGFQAGESEGEVVAA